MEKELDFSAITTEELEVAIDWYENPRAKPYACMDILCSECPLECTDYGESPEKEAVKYEQFKAEYSRRMSSCASQLTHMDFIPEDSDRTVSAQGGVKEVAKNGIPKTMYQLYDPEFYEGTCKVLTLGAIKYEKDNWQKVDKEEYERAVESHFQEYKKGNKIDPETGLSHLYHCACNLMFLDYFDRKEVSIDE